MSDDDELLNGFEKALPYSGKPDFVNADGYKWWKVKPLNDYATSKGLADISSWVLEQPNGQRAFVLFKNKRPVKEYTTYEAILLGIDVEALVAGGGL